MLKRAPLFARTIAQRQEMTNNEAKTLMESMNQTGDNDNTEIPNFFKQNF